MLNAKELAAERRLIEASQKDPGRFGELYERYFHRVYAFALTRTRERTAAEDVTAETFRQAFQHLSRFEWRGVPFSAWLFRIAANAATDAQTRGARQAWLDDLPEAAADDWQAAFVQIEQRVELFELVRRLPRDQRRAIEMRIVQEQSLKQTAEAMGRSEGAIKQLQFRALHRLRGWVGERYD